MVAGGPRILEVQREGWRERLGQTPEAAQLGRNSGDRGGVHLCFNQRI